ncbi:hypothetical protein CLOM_g3281 [Closterium sp. NIES-68]|nr:hypothetical protein CLOM_g3281 [Closterium sp. NIES-68]GJP73073.1 hypothetical protein CLOP_g3824 [Closterium sp. NIES-67]
MKKVPSSPKLSSSQLAASSPTRSQSDSFLSQNLLFSQSQFLSQTQDWHSIPDSVTSRPDEGLSILTRLADSLKREIAISLAGSALGITRPEDIAGLSDSDAFAIPELLPLTLLLSLVSAPGSSPLPSQSHTPLQAILGKTASQNLHHNPHNSPHHRRSKVNILLTSNGRCPVLERSLEVASQMAKRSIRHVMGLQPPRGRHLLGKKVSAKSEDHFLPYSGVDGLSAGSLALGSSGIVLTDISRGLVRQDAAVLLSQAMDRHKIFAGSAGMAVGCGTVWATYFGEDNRSGGQHAPCLMSNSGTKETATRLASGLPGPVLADLVMTKKDAPLAQMLSKFDIVLSPGNNSGSVPVVGGIAGCGGAAAGMKRKKGSKKTGGNSFLDGAEEVDLWDSELPALMTMGEMQQHVEAASRMSVSALFSEDACRALHAYYLVIRRAKMDQSVGDVSLLTLESLIRVAIACAKLCMRQSVVKNPDVLIAILISEHTFMAKHGFPLVPSLALKLRHQPLEVVLEAFESDLEHVMPQMDSEE